jgi:hypothetical protein
LCLDAFALILVPSSATCPSFTSPARSHEQTGAELQAEVDGWLKAAEAGDAKAFGTDKRGDEMRDWAADKQARLAKIREAKAELEAEAKARAAAEQAARERMTTS